jgi:hypothetical protein
MQPGCKQKSPQQCLDQALEAMGGRERLRQLKSARIETIGHTLLTEQSYRQAPFLVFYERAHLTIDLTHQQIMREAHITWPESDPNQSDITETTVANLDGCVRHTKNGGLARTGSSASRHLLPMRVGRISAMVASFKPDERRN